MWGKFLRKKVSEICIKRDKIFAKKKNAQKEKILTPKVDSNLNIDQKVSYLLGEMTINEKINLIAGEKNFAISAIPRLGLQRIWCSDASSGVHNYGRCTAFPSTVAMAASWNRKLMQKVGETIGEECRAKGVSILLAPGVNIYRVPTNGRNFEYLGEDPFLASELVVPYILGVQNQGVITTIKHFACNNSDYDRHRSNSIVDERTLHEIYFPAFKAAIQRGGSKGVMCAYNLLNGVHCSEDEYLLNTILRDKWGFKGFIISDWNSLYSTEGPLQAGLDLEMPSPKYYTKEKIKNLLDDKTISIDTIDEKVVNLLRSFFTAGVYDRSAKSSQFLEYGPEHDAIAKKVASECLVLLKNENSILPLDLNRKQKIVLLGRNADPTPTSGGGSCFMVPYESPSILESINSIKGNMTDLVYLSYKKNKLNKTEIEEIEAADYVILAIGLTHLEDGEFWDRNWEMVENQNQFILKVAELNPNIIVVLNAGGGIESESWIHKVPAVLHSFYLGQNAGIVAEILFGLINPSGKLPFTMAKNWNDFSTVKNYIKHPEKLTIKRMFPGTRSKQRWKNFPINYKEGIMVGYRHFDSAKIEPQFPFGFGLSYTTFKYTNLQSSSTELSRDGSLNISVDVTNTGKRTGMEIIQLYIRDIECSAIRPEKELKGFEKLSLKPNETKTVQFIIDHSHLAFYDEKIHDWRIEPGLFEVLIGSSSCKIAFSTQFNYK